MPQGDAPRDAVREQCGTGVRLVRNASGASGAPRPFSAERPGERRGRLDRCSHRRRRQRLNYGYLLDGHFENRQFAAAPPSCHAGHHGHRRLVDRDQRRCGVQQRLQPRGAGRQRAVVHPAGRRRHGATGWHPVRLLDGLCVIEQSTDDEVALVNVGGVKQVVDDARIPGSGHRSPHKPWQRPFKQTPALLTVKALLSTNV